MITTEKDIVKFIHSSDWQLGMTRAFLSSEAAARFTQDRINAIGALGRLATEHDAGFIVVAGDVFESNQLSRQTLSRALDALEALPVPVFLLPGNHDPFDAASIYRTKEFRNAGNHIMVLRDARAVPVPGLDNVEVIGAPWRTKRPNSDLCAEMANAPKPAASTIRIAVAHGQVNTLSPDPSRPEVIDVAGVERAIEEGKYHYLALGDRHSVTEVGGTGRVWYSGAPVATAFDEIDANKALVVKLDTQGNCAVEPFQVGSWTFIAEERAMNGPADLAGFEDWLTGLADKECAAVKVAFVGSINLATAAALDEVMDSKAELFASLRRRERTTRLAIVPDELDRDSVSLSGYARDTWNELLEMAQRGDTVAQDSLRLLYRLSAQGERS